MIAATMFSGIGAPECAMPHWDWRWCAEIEKFPSAVLKTRFPDSINLGDVHAEDFVARAEGISGRPDVVVFGSPCQDFSVAGRRVGLDGDRGNLALVALGVVNRLRPCWVVFENVPGLLSSRSGSAEAERSLRDRIERGTGRLGDSADGEEDSDFAAFLALVRECGYFGCYRITDAQYAGVPQRRRRVFAVFHLGDWRPAAAVLFEPEGLRGDNPPSRETGEGVAGTISARTSAGGGLGTDLELNGGLNESAVQQTPINVPEIAWALQERDHKGADSDTKEGHLIVADVAPTLLGGSNASGGNRRPGTASNDTAALVVASVAPTLVSGGHPSGGGTRPPGLKIDESDALIVTAFEPRDRGDDGRGHERPPNFMENVSPALNSTKTPVVAFDCKAGGNTGFSIGDLAGALRGDGHGGGHAAIAFSSKDYGGDAAIDQTPTLRAMESDKSHANGGGQIAIAFQTRIARNGRGSESEVVPALNGADAGATSDMRPCVAVFKPSHFTRGKDGAPSNVSPPLGAEPDKGDQDMVLMTETAVRRLTPRECERLQAFPDDHTLIQFRGAPASDGPRYKALGNAMNVKEIQWVLQRIERFEKEKASW